MCTVALAHRVYAGAPLLLAANRDEARARPSETWHAWPDRAIFAPRDAIAGGTWIGVSARGLVAAVTNRAGHPRDPARRSRGLLVLDALAAPDVATALRAAAALDPASISPFHLLVADATAAALVINDGTTMTARALDPGWIVVTERSFGAAASIEREARVRAQLEAHREAPSPDAIRAILTVHAASADVDERLGATCVHLDELGYGTRSSSLITLGDRWPDARVLHADGPPCVTPYVDLAASWAAFAA